MGRRFFKANRADTDAAMRAKFARVRAAPEIFLCACGNARSPQAAQCANCYHAKQRKDNADRRATERAAKLIEKFNETKIETKPNVPAEPETPESADVSQGSSDVPNGRNVLRLGDRSISQRKSIWTIDSEEFRERMPFSMPHLRRGKQ
jgi:hypothetical protein